MSERRQSGQEDDRGGGRKRKREEAESSLGPPPVETTRREGSPPPVGAIPVSMLDVQGSRGASSIGMEIDQSGPMSFTSGGRGPGFSGPDAHAPLHFLTPSRRDDANRYLPSSSSSSSTVPTSLGSTFGARSEEIEGGSAGPTRSEPSQAEDSGSSSSSTSHPGGQSSSGGGGRAPAIDVSPYRDTIRRAAETGGAKGRDVVNLSLAYGLEARPTPTKPAPATESKGSKASRPQLDPQLDDWHNSLVSAKKNPKAVASCAPFATRLMDEWGVDDRASGDGASSNGGGSSSGGSALSYYSKHGDNRHFTRPMNTRHEGEPNVPPHVALGTALQEIKAGQRESTIMRYSHGAHSIVLVAHPGGVEPMETWASNRNPKMLHDDFFLNKQGTNATHRLLSLDEAIAASQDLGHEKSEVRGAALGKISDAGLTGFEPEDKYKSFADVPVGLDVRRMKPRDEIARSVEKRVGTITRSLKDPVVKAKLKLL